MKRYSIFMLLAIGSLSALAEEFKLEPTTVITGKIKPQITKDAGGTILQFSASTEQGSAVIADQNHFDISHGCKIELEFRDDAKQTNKFPRLLELGKISLHLVSDPQSASGDKLVKALINSQNNKKFNQIQIPLEFQAGTWHRLVFTYLPENKIISMQLDGTKRIFEPMDCDFPQQELSLILGGNSMENCLRGYSGAIRNVSITTPYKEKNVPNLTFTVPETANGQPIKHLTVSAIPGRHLAFPGLTQMPNGDLAAVFREGLGHVCPYGRICITFSKDGGANWSAPIAVADTASDERDPAINTLPDGRVIITYGGWNSWMAEAATAKNFSSATSYIQQAGAEKFGGAKCIISTDNGATWSKPLDLPAFAPHGPLYYQGHFYYPTLANRNNKRQVDFYQGTADALNWQKLATIGESKLGNVSVIPVYEEPHAAVLPDGTFVTAIRVPSDGYMRISFSKDQGKTWTEPIKTTVKGYPQHLLALKDGRLLATYGYRYRPYGIRGCISRDGGKTWDIDKEIVIRSGGESIDLGYPVSIERKNGEVMTVYYYVSKEHADCFIEGAIYQP